METTVMNATEYRNVSLSLLSESKTKPRLGACVQRDFSEQAPQSPDEALYIV
jgi:hypothetical protein